MVIKMKRKFEIWNNMTKEEYKSLFEKAKELDSIEEWRKQDVNKKNKV